MSSTAWESGCLCLVVAILAASVTQAAPCPVIERTRAGCQLVLPSSFQKALQEAAPGFTPWKLSDYDPDVQKGYDFTARQAPWAVVGDFNGDGWCDLVIDGHDSSTTYRFCVWGGLGRHRILQLSARPWERAGEPLNSVLQFYGPGEVGTNFTDSTIFIFTDGFNDYGWEKSGTLYFWKKDHFGEFTTSD